MEASVIQLLIVDDNPELCDILEDFFRLTPDIQVCGVARDGEEALFRIAQSQPDVVLLDLIMPKMDGITVLERLGQAELARRPKFIVTSAIGQDAFTATALSLGADYYMIKPYDLSALSARVRLVADQRADPAPKRGPKGMDAAQAVLEVGIPPHVLGFRYCIAGVELLLETDGPCSIVKDVYAGVAERFDTTPSCVEGAIRKAIRRVWEEKDGSFPLLHGLGDTSAAPPANGRFLMALRAYVASPPDGKEQTVGNA